MFVAKFATSLALVAPLVSALSIITPTNWTSSDPASLDWTTAAGDPQTFSIELVNNLFNRQFALANNVPTGQSSISFTLPVVPVGDGYTLQFINISNATDIFAETGDFAIGASISSSMSSASSVSGSASASVSASLTATNSASTSGFGTTRSATATGASATGSGTGTGSASVGSSTTFNSGAVALVISNTNLASFGVMAVAALAGARLVGF